VSSSIGARVRIAVVLLVALVLQATFGADLRIFGVAPDFMLLVAICGGLVCGPTTGAWIGFLAGLLADLTMSTTPLGLTALVWCLVGWGLGTLGAYVLPESRVVRPAIAFLASVAALLLFLLVGELVGQSGLVAPGRTWIVKAIVIEGLWNALLAIPTVVVMRWAARGLASVEALRRPDTVMAR
jgi:rod shape-determining protein MreD